MKWPLPSWAITRPWLTATMAVGVVAGVLMPDHWAPDEAGPTSRILFGWNVGQWGYLICLLWLMARADVQGVRSRAERLDQSGWVDIVLAIVGPLMSVAAIVLELMVDGPGGRAFSVGLTVSTIAGAWFANALIFGLHYANLYYRQAGEPPLRFPDERLEPDYWDFLYFSFTITVAQQTADVSIASRPMRRVVLMQALLAYLFNLAVLALSINVASNLLSR